MNKLERKLSADNRAVISARAKNAMDDCAAEMDTLIAKLEKNKRNAVKELTNLTDIGPDNTTSLRVVDESFNAERWIQQIHELKMEIRLADIEIKVALETKEEWFSDKAEDND